ncbi:RagB/SusD family nutrient uptake outer membrane protein [Flavobacterium sp. GT2N3]|uniref:RagB/SusD family nutrient uptake outer membrane protein n=1 Tax=unclassified Flavobacterium TaxID=196869 RepID=UPI003AAEAEF0
MKNIFIAALIAITLISCSSELDQTPISELGSNNFYSNTGEFESAVNGIYSSLRFYPDNQFYLSEVRSDNMYAVTDSGVRDYEPVNNFQPTLTTNSYVNTVWNTNYAGILRANTVLEKLSETAVPDVTVRTRMEGEARFLRAFFYFDLVRLYGKVPLMDKVYTPTETLNIGRSSVSVVYDFILNDLESAIASLPTTYAVSQKGKATSWAAKALLAEVYLTRSGPTYGIEGPGMNTGEYALALSLMNDIITNGPFGLVSNYASIFAYNNENNMEMIFDIQYSSGGTGVGGSYPSISVTEGYLRAKKVGFPNGEDRKNVSTNLLNTYTNADIRDDFSILLKYTDENNNVISAPSFVKYLNLSYAGQDRFDWSLNYPVIRYTDILMMKAEAILMGGVGSQQDVDNAVNLVRKRAGLADISGVNIDKLLEEKRLEFAGESKRWYDLVRTGKVIDVMNAWIPGEDIVKRMNTMQANYVIYPVPANQMTVKTGLYEQNPGYN